MKHIIILTVACLVLSGCASNNPPQQTKIAEPAAFPDYLVGTWKVESKGIQWAFTLDKEGKLLEYYHMLGGQKPADQNIVEESPDPNYYGKFVFGDSYAAYDHKTRELAIEVNLDYYKMRLPIGTIEGRMKDYFFGAVSDDGKQWDADWLSYGWLEGAQEPDMNDVKPEPLTFRKILDQDLEETKK